jgi:hypothetical protein
MKIHRTAARAAALAAAAWMAAAFVVDANADTLLERGS